MGFLDWIFGSKKPTYPRITNEMFQPLDSAITTAEAKRLYRDLTVKLGYHKGKSEAIWGVELLVQSINDHAEHLKFELEEAKQNLDSLDVEKELIKELKADLKKCKDASERTEIETEIKAAEAIITRDEAAVIEASEALKQFKKNKRSFLIDYLNHELHGDNLR